jgi:hypothetical protein
MHLLVRNTFLRCYSLLMIGLIEYMELSGNLQQSMLQFYSPEYVDGPVGKRMAWLTSRGLFHATLSTARPNSGDLSSQDLLDASSLLPYPTALSDGTIMAGRSPGVRDATSTDGFPTGVVLTEFHFILLLKDRVVAFSRLDESLVYDELISLVCQLSHAPSFANVVCSAAANGFWEYLQTQSTGLYGSILPTDSMKSSESTKSETFGEYTSKRRITPLLCSLPK